ncbi:MAG: hypothetical protein AAF596_04820, partial [Planctomycetota bacterium]
MPPFAAAMLNDARHQSTRPLLIACLALCACGGCGRGYDAAEPSIVPPPTRVFALGRLEPRSGVIDISGLPGERLKALDGDVVAGELAPANGLLGVL